MNITLVILSAALLAIGLALTGCSFGPANNGAATLRADKPTTPVIIASIAEDAATARAALGTASVTIDGLTTENLPAQKPALVEQIKAVDVPLAKIEAEAPAAKKSSMEDASREQKAVKEVAKLQAADPVRRALEWTGYLFILAGIVAVVASFFAGVIGGHLRAGGIAAIAVGLCAATLAYYLGEIRLAIAVTLGLALLAGLVWAILYAIRNRRILLDSIKSIDAGRAAGQIVFTPEASDPAKSVVKAWQSDETKKFVDAVQAKTAVLA